MGTLALRAERQSAQMSEIKNDMLDLDGTEHSKCSHLTTLGFNWLMDASVADPDI